MVWAAEAHEVVWVAWCAAVFEGADVVHRMGDPAAWFTVLVDVLAHRMVGELLTALQAPCLA
jgi:hypothetical protein